jgi:hypothetical protein
MFDVLNSHVINVLKKFVKLRFTAAGNAQIPGSRLPTKLNFFSGCTSYMWVLIMGLASRHPSGTWNFEAAATFFENLCTPFF